MSQKSQEPSDDVPLQSSPAPAKQSVTNEAAKSGFLLSKTKIALVLALIVILIIVIIVLAVLFGIAKARLQGEGTYRSLLFFIEPLNRNSFLNIIK